MNDLITIGMPVYNVEKYVERALLSALNQTYPNIEYIVVDDKGTDRSMEIVEQIKNAHPRGSAIKIIDHVINRSLGATRNTSMDFASGKYIFFLDSDDEITPDCIEVLYHEIIRTNADTVGGSRMVIAGNQNTENIWPDRVWNGKEQVVLSFFEQTSLYNTNKLYNVSFLKKYKLRVDLVNSLEDIPFCFNIALNASTIAMISKITYFYYLNEESITSGGDWSEKIYKDWVNVFQKEKMLIDTADWTSRLRIKTKKKFFAQRLIIANTALKSQYNVQHYIQDYLSPQFFDKDIWKSIVLFVLNLYSKMPLCIKKTTIPFLMSVKNMLK